MKKKINWLYPILLLALMVVIFCFSAQVADDSSITSSRVCWFLARHFFGGFEELTESAQKKLVDGMTFVVRKGAHFSEYALMGFLWYLWLHRVKFAPLLAFAATLAYSCSDEIHQLFVPGRSGEFRDVLVDSSGALCGILAAFVLICIVYCVRRREIVHWGTWAS